MHNKEHNLYNFLFKYSRKLFYSVTEPEGLKVFFLLKDLAPSLYFSKRQKNVVINLYFYRVIIYMIPV